MISNMVWAESGNHNILDAAYTLLDKIVKEVK
jgi:hypothetical protein